MARFRERFEVKNEMYDGGKIRPDDSYKQNGGKSSKTQQQEILANVNEIVFDNEYEDIDKVDVYEDNEKNVEDKGKENKLQNLSEQVVQKIMTGYQNVSIGGELHANAYIASEAKKLGVEKNELYAFIVEKGKESINSPDKVLHYHRTSMQSFEQIMQTGFLLNRKNMQLNGMDTSNLSGSSSANVQFTRDVYNTDGELQMSGFGRDNVGANSTDVVFVMGPELINEETYNCFMPYPIVEKADIQKCCVAILAKDPNIQMQIEGILKGKNLSIKTMLQEEFDRDVILEELARADVSKQVEETGAILHSVNGKPIREEETGMRLKSVNGRDILSSAIEATEETTRTSTINNQVQTIRSIQRNRTQQQDKMFR